MNINPVNNINFCSTFRKNTLFFGITSNLKSNLDRSFYGIEDIDRANEYANALFYIKNDKQHDIYELKADKKTSNGVILMKNDEEVAFLSSDESNSRIENSENIIKQYVQKEFEKDLSKEQTRSQIITKKLDNVFEYANNKAEHYTTTYIENEEDSPYTINKKKNTLYTNLERLDSYRRITKDKAKREVRNKLTKLTNSI